MKHISTVHLNFSVTVSFFLLVTVFCFSGSLFGQTTLTQTLRGVVLDIDNNQPIVGANVTLTGTDKGTITEADGSFRFTAIPIGRYSVQISSIGFETTLIPEVLLEAGKESPNHFPQRKSSAARRSGCAYRPSCFTK